MGGFAWVTLATNDSYSLGALVLGHSLRRAGTPHDLVALVTPGVSESMRNQLSTVFTLVKEVNILDSRDEANLALLERPDLGITFTKLHCWRLTQYEKCVFLDADTLVLKNSDELFEREELSAAPDPGWPDCFNSGVFVYRPSLDTFNALIKFALAKGSFDGGDQGLLNMFFSDWATKDISRHLPFIYNMVSTATYSYLPAYKQFGEGAKIAHFIGANKPWLQYFDSETRLARSPAGSEHIQPLLQLWWDIFCSTVHPSLSPEMLGLAGALAQLTLGVPRTAEQTAFEEHMRRQAWEQGNMDYMGRDSFDNIWRKITETLAQAPTKPATEEVPPTQSAPEPKIPDSETPAPISRKSPPAVTSEAPEVAAEPTPSHSSDVTETPIESKSIEPSPLAPIETTLSQQSASVQEKPVQVVPHTPSVTEATPPTSPPIVIPTADIRALIVDAPPPETPPVGSGTSELVSDTQLKTAQPPEQALPGSENLNIQKSLQVTEAPTVVEQKKLSETPDLTEKSSQAVPALKEITSSTVVFTADVPVSLVDNATPIVSSGPQISSTQESSIVINNKQLQEKDVCVPCTVDNTESPAKLDTVPQTEGKKVEVSASTNVEESSPVSPPVHKVEVIGASVTEIKPAAEKDTLSQQMTEVPVPATATTEIQTVTETAPVPESVDKIKASVLPSPSSDQPQVAETPVTTSTNDKTPVTGTETPILPISSSGQPQVTETPVPISTPPPNDQTPVKEIQTSISPVSSSDQAQTPLSLPPSSDQTQVPIPSIPSSKQEQVTDSQSCEKPVSEDVEARPLPAPTAKGKKEAGKSAGKKPSVELKESSVQATQPEQGAKTPPSKPSVTSTPDTPPPDQAPVPPKRRGHKGAGAAASTEQGAASKSTAQTQSQQTKGSKSTQKSKK